MTLLTAQQSAELLSLPNLPDKAVIINALFDYLTVSAEQNKFTEFLTNLTVFIHPVKRATAFLLSHHVHLPVLVKVMLAFFLLQGKLHLLFIQNAVSFTSTYTRHFEGVKQFYIIWHYD